jgi:hypothetical protein
MMMNEHFLEAVRATAFLGDAEADLVAVVLAVDDSREIRTRERENATNLRISR